MTDNLLPRREFVRLAGLGGLLLPSQLAQAQPSTVDARTQFGSVRGLRVGPVNTFKGVPYGADTGGENRFMPPQEPTLATCGSHRNTRRTKGVGGSRESEGVRLLRVREEQRSVATGLPVV